MKQKTEKQLSDFSPDGVCGKESTLGLLVQMRHFKLKHLVTENEFGDSGFY